MQKVRKMKAIKHQGRIWYDVIVYTKEEADAQGLDYVYWRDIKDAPNTPWVMTDDGQVTKVRSYREYAEKDRKNRGFYLLRTDIGSLNLRRKDKFLAEERIRLRAFASIKPQTWVSQVLATPKGKKFIVGICRLMARHPNRKQPKDADIAVIVKEFVPGIIKPLSFYKYFTRFKETQMAIKEEMQAAYTANGVDVQYALDILKNAVAIASQKKDSKTLIAAFGQLKEILDMVPKEPKANQVQMIPGTDGDLAFLESAMQGALSAPTQPSSVLLPMIEQQQHEMADILSITTTQAKQ